MTDHPMLFTGPMVRALLEGRKTQTRRPIKPTGEAIIGMPMFPCYANGKRIGETSRPEFFNVNADVGGEPFWSGSSPYCPGDLIWVRETFLAVGGLQCPDPRIVYRATNDGSDAWVSPSWRPSIHMPRWASRLTLTITDVRVQRVCEITDEDVLAEGVDPACGIRGDEDISIYLAAFINGFSYPKTRFVSLWHSLYVKRGLGWDANPWVVALTFSVEQRNIDDAPRNTKNAPDPKV